MAGGQDSGARDPLEECLIAFGDVCDVKVNGFQDWEED